MKRQLWSILLAAFLTGAGDPSLSVSWNQLAPASPLAHHETPSFPFENTFLTILESLGSLSLDSQPLPLPESATKGAASAAPYTLSPEGRAFFAEILKTEPHLVTPRAYLVFLGKKPFGFAVSHHFGKGFYFLNFSNLAMNPPHNREPDPSLLRECLNSLYPCRSDAVRQFSSLHVVEAPPYNMRRPGRPPWLRLLSIRHDWHEIGGIGREPRLPELFAPDDLASLDYQQIIHHHKELLRGKRVMEIGAGTGVNILLALRFGAAEVWGTELSFAYHILSRWNLAYAEETGQIPIGAAERVKLVRGNGFGTVPNADIYLFNTPRVSGNDEMPWITEGVEDINLMTYNILAEKFFPIFDELMQRLSVKETQAIWRILIAESALGSGAPSRDELRRAFPPLTSGSRIVSEYFLRRKNISFELLLPEDNLPGDIYLLSIESAL